MTRPYSIVVGLEVHVQLLTESKLFCGCSTVFGRSPNTQTCPVCCGMPGVLPVLNRKAFELGLKAALSVGGEIARFTKWDRKHYFYPDLPKNYQISQYDLPFCVGGMVTIPTEGGGTKEVRLIRIHLEEDAGKNNHAEAGGDSLVDLNRAGTPLLEIVSEPDMSSAEEAGAYLETIRTMMIDLDVSDCEMQEGSLRCDANVNLHIRQDDTVYKTPVVEVKNLNSIKNVEKAIAFEAERQYEQWKKDGKVLGSSPKQTRGWDDAKGATRKQREKEEAADYRYFPEPDLVPVVVEDAWIEKVRLQMGETSAQRTGRYRTEHGLSDYNAETLVAKGRAGTDYFERLLALGVDAKSAANWILNDLYAHATGRIKKAADLPVVPERLAELIGLVKASKLNLNDAREKVMHELVASGESAAEIAKRLGLEVVADAGAIDAVCDEVIRDMAQAAADFRAGKEKAFGSLVGQVMKRSKGKFPPALVNEALLRKLKSE
ncbi:MAG TPA: Asp-tRNA(Asn)/Glu-tRNA(Gln) amidotransferase subunit GatB [Planctomycetia bacterium]|nr:Asp-tRNA(Asn)/Glu-tRNA(Gln) amidotransferase subunit GatB [Planctomycetia bacterium]